MKNRAILCMLCIFGFICLAGCSSESKEESKLEDLSFTVLESQNIPEEFAQRIELNKSKPFQLTYEDDALYIAVGYGEQNSGGYSIEVSGFYLSENGICVNTKLIGPKKNEKVSESKSYPFIVIKTQRRDEKVIFNN